MLSKKAFLKQQAKKQKKKTGYTKVPSTKYTKIKCADPFSKKNKAKQYQ